MAGQGPKRRLSTGRRAAFLIWLVLGVAYGSTLGMDSVPGHDYAGDEPHYLLAARSLTDDHTLDVRHDYQDKAYGKFDPLPPRPQGRFREGARYEPHSIGLPLLAAPFYAIGG